MQLKELNNIKPVCNEIVYINAEPACKHAEPVFTDLLVKG